MVIKKILVQSEEPEYTGVLWAKLNGDSIDLKLYRGNKWISVPENKFTPEQIAQIIDAVSEQITPEDLGTLSRYQIQALLNTKANVSAIPTKVSDLDNDSEFITTETDPTVPSHVKSITQTNIDTWSNKQDTISDLTSIRSGASLGSTAYQKPSTGIPKTDLSQEVQNALDNPSITSETDPVFTASPAYNITSSNISSWNNKYSLPNTGIPLSDLSEEVQDAIENAGSLTEETDPIFVASAAHGITSSDISNWNGKYTKSNSGIPKTDLASDVQTSLGKADSALQSYTETDPTVPSHVKSITTANISSWNAKQNALTFDATPTANSTNPVTSAGIKAYVDNATPTITMDDTPTSGSNNPVKSGGIYTALQGKQNTLTFDSTPTASSTNPVTSGGVKAALDLKANQSTTYTKTEVDALFDDVAYLGDDDGTATTLDFDPQADTVWNIPQTLGSSQQAQARANIGVVDVSGINDGTNWTSITIGSTTKAIPSGGGGSGDENVIESITFNGTAATIDSTTKNAAISYTPPVTSVNNQTGAVSLSIPTESTVSGWGFTKNTGNVSSTTITTIVSLTEAQYTALATKDASTLYVILES